MLQSLLQPRDNQRPKMIGAMPAVAVRHERRRVEKRSGGGRRPSQLPLNIGRPPDAEATPSPDHHRLRNELYKCAKVAFLHAVVGALLLGIVVLVVGLVQLSPGAEAAHHRYYFIGTGAALTGAGIVGAVLRCLCLTWFDRMFREEEEEEEPVPTTHKNGVSVVESSREKPGHDHKGHDHKAHDHKGHDHKTHEHKTQEHKGHEHKTHDPKVHDHKCHEITEQKPRLKSQASVGRDIDLIKQPSATSDI